MKKLKFILSVLLSFLIVFSVFPSTVYADSNFEFDNITYTFTSKYNNTYGSTVSNNVVVSSDPIFVKNISDFSFLSDITFSGSRGDKLLVTIDVTKCTFTNWLLDTTISFNKNDLKYSGGDSCYYRLNQSETSHTFEFELLKDLSNYQLSVFGVCSYMSYSSSLADTFLQLSINGNYSVTDEKTGLLNSILEWLENIRDKIVNLPGEFGSFITDLKTNLSSWFNDLKSNISQWFSDVGDWFVDLGDNIGSFFTDLWDNISLKFETINTDISNWWQGVKDWFHSLFVPEDGWVEDYKKRIDSFLAVHLGMVYEAPRLISSIFTLILGAFKKPANGSVIIPRITVPGTSYVLVDYTEFNLNTIINSNERFKWMYDTFKIASSAILFLFVLNYCRKELDEFLKDREVSE